MHLKRTALHSGGAREVLSEGRDRTRRSKTAVAPDPVRTLPLPNQVDIYPVDRPTQLELGGGFKVATTNFQVDANGVPREDSPHARVVLSQPPEIRDRINQRVASRHADNGMDFCKKNEKTGRYDTYFDVPVSSMLLTMEKSAYERLIRSTEPVMRAFRHIAQVVYSQHDPTPEDFGIGHIPEGEREIFMRCIRECIYFEPKLVDPELASYPFVPVVGFDAAPNDPANPEPVFHEANAGTPSGLSNNNQLLEHLRREDPEQIAAIEDRLFEQDDTFAIVRQAIESCALEWTKNPDGISVCIGPGPANGAHPDVASIAAYSGMPMVYPHDLYQDRDGNIRLMTGDPKSDPVVTGIYGRTEETYFFQNDELGIPIRSPDFSRNDEIAAKLSKKLGKKIELEPNVIYQFAYKNPDRISDWSDPNEITGVALDRKGRPKIMSAWSQLSADPTRPNEPPGKLADAVKQRKLYFSGFGGRIVDHKSLFAIVSKYLAPQFANGEDAPIARPPRTLGPEDDHEYYADPRKFVTKPPDASGGQGVHIGPALSDEALAASVERTRKHRNDIVVQDFWTTALTTDVKTNKRTGEKYYGTTLPDIRTFSFLFADGTVKAGEQSFLVRTDVQDIGKTNTGSGGGYGILAILGEPGRRQHTGEPLTPVRAELRWVAQKHMEELLAFLAELNAIAAATDPGSGAFPRDGRAQALGERFLRPVMDLLGEEAMPLLRLTRRFDAGEISQSELHHALLGVRLQLFEKQDYTNSDVARQVRQQLALYAPGPAGPGPGQARPSRLRSLRSLRAVACTAPAQEKKRSSSSGSFEVLGLPTLLPAHLQLGGDVSLFSMGRLTGGGPEVTRMLDRVRAAGGEVEVYRAQVKGSGAWAQKDGLPPLFYLDEKQRPRIAIASGSDIAADLRAILPRFERWLETKEELVRDGNLPERAAELAYDFHRGDPEAVRENAAGGAPVDPAIRALRAALRAHAQRRRVIDRDGVKQELAGLIRGALEKREQELKLYTKQERALAGKKRPSRQDQQELLRVRSCLASARERMIFDDVIPPREQRAFDAEGSFELLRELYREAYQQVAGRAAEDVTPKFRPTARWKDSLAVL